MMLLTGRLTTSIRTVLGGSLRPCVQAKRTLISMATLPYDVKDGVLPLITPKSLDLHYNKVCIGFCQTANDLIQGTILDTLDPMAILNRAKIDAQSSLLYHSLGSSIIPGGSPMSKNLEKLVTANYGSVEEFKRRFNRNAAATFSNGWTFIVIRDGRLEIMNCRDGATAYAEKGVWPLACIDLWEHAYFTDYQNRRNEYINRFWDVVDWKTIEDRINEEMPEVW